MPVKKDATKNAALAATTPAAFARIIGKDGRSVRNVLRSRFGVYVSKGGTFDADTRAALYAHIVEKDENALPAWQDARK